MRIATWNLMGAMSSGKVNEVLWDWASQNLQADCYVFTECKSLNPGVPAGWDAIWDPAGVYPDNPRQWGTAVATTSVELRRVESAKYRFRTLPLAVTWPAAVQVAEVWNNGIYWATVVGFYAVTRDGNGESNKSGRYSWPTMMGQLSPLLRSPAGRRLIVAGDMNLHPQDISRVAREYGLIDLVEYTAGTRPQLQGCVSCRPKDGCQHMWTHRNRGGASPSVQQIDYILASKSLARELVSIRGGYADFPDSHSLSDHAPVVAEFRN